MKKSVLEIYALAVCFVGVIAIVISLSISIYSLVEVIYPDFAVNQWEFQKHLSNDKFWEDYRNIKYNSTLNEEPVRPSEEELTRLRNESYSLVLINAKRDSTQILIRSIIFLTISLLFFTLHWKLFKKSQEQKLS